jgi:DNA-binding NtrC family response regulator
VTRDPEPPLILLADDQPDVLEALRLLLKTEGYETRSAASPAEILKALEAEPPDVLLMDLNYTRDTTSGREGLELLDEVRSRDPDLPVVVMTAWGSIELAVEAMRRGARDFLEKPWENARLLAVVGNQVELAGSRRRERRLAAANRILVGEGTSEIVARSPAMEPVLELVERIGPSDASVLVTGENGTGKGLVARLLHSVSPRAEAPLVTVNVGDLADSVFESELFGHVKGAFTDAREDRIGRFEMADGGTLFLDEVANVPLPQQAKLLRVVETGELEPVGSSRTRRVDVRLLSATNADLEREVAAGSFRRDLYFRLRTVEIPLPPLRRRREDVLPLADLFLERHARRYRKRPDGFDEAAREALLGHPWPGNVRELDHAVERGVLMAQERWITAADLGLGGEAPTLGDAVEDMTLEQVEARCIEKALERTDGNVRAAARELGLSRSALYRRLEKYGLS